MEVLAWKIHWANRRVSRPGLRNFLKLAAAIYEKRFLALDKKTGMEWMHLWKTNVWAFRIARKKFHILIPASKSKHDRRKTAKQLTKIKPELRNQAAWKWAKETM